MGEGSAMESSAGMRAAAWIRNVSPQLHAGVADFAQADIDELVRLERDWKLADIAVEMFTVMVAVLQELELDYFLQLSIPVDDVTVDAILADRGTLPELVDSAVFPSNLRGVSLPSFILDRESLREMPEDGVQFRRSLGCLDSSEESRTYASQVALIHGTGNECHDHTLEFRRYPAFTQPREAVATVLLA